MKEPWHISDPLPVNIELESFNMFTNELARHCAEGVCMNPQYSRPFTPSRASQKYCCEKCRLFGDNELRKVGLMAAPALLAHRLGKNIKKPKAGKSLTPEQEELRRLASWGQNYLAQLESAWLQERRDRAEVSVHMEREE